MQLLHGQFDFTLYQANMVILVILVSCMIWWLYNRFVRPRVHFMGTVLWDPPRSIKCIIKDISNNPKKNNCEKINVDYWSVAHAVLYAAIGLFVPHKYALVLVLSVVCEVFEFYSGWRAKWILDPIVNMGGYIVGSALSPLVSGVHFDVFDTTRATYWMVVVTIIVLVLNRPVLMPNPEQYF